MGESPGSAITLKATIFSRAGSHQWLKKRYLEPIWDATATHVMDNPMLRMPGCLDGTIRRGTREAGKFPNPESCLRLVDVYLTNYLGYWPLPRPYPLREPLKSPGEPAA